MESTCVVQPLNNNGYACLMGNGSGALLDMLAEVASQKLHSDPSVKETVIKRNVNRTRSTKKNFRAVNISEFSIEEIRNLTANNLLKLFTEFDGNEMKKTFTFTCFLEPRSCKKEISSFGSETKARKLMKCHLMEHISDLLSRFSCENSNVKLQKRQNAEIISESHKKRRRNSYIKDDSSFRSEIVMENNELSSNDNECEINSIPVKGLKCEETYVNDPVPQIIVNEGNSNHDSSVTVHSDHNYASSNMAHDIGGENDNGLNTMCFETIEVNGDSSNDILRASCLKVDENVNISSTEGDKNSKTDMKSSLNNDDYDMPHFPWIEQEVDISTNFSILPLNTYVNVPVIESSEVSCIEGRDDSTTCIESNEIPLTYLEEEELANKKKPKGKAKFIGQSQAEKEMAMRLIDFMKFHRIPNDNLECHICDPPRSFTAATTLISHYRSHAGIKPFECRICTAVFTRQHSLNYHMLIHSNQTRFTCTECGRKFRHPSHFKEHLRRHTGESPFQCGDCMTRFKTRNTYKRHLKTRHGKILTSVSNVIITSQDEKSEGQVSVFPQEVVGEGIPFEQKIKKSRVLCEPKTRKPKKVVKVEYVSEETVSLPDTSQYEKEDETTANNKPWEPSVNLSVVDEQEQHCFNSDNVEEIRLGYSDSENGDERKPDFSNSNNEEGVQSYLNYENEGQVEPRFLNESNVEVVPNYLSRKGVEDDTPNKNVEPDISSCMNLENVEKDVPNYLDQNNEEEHHTNYSNGEALDLNQCYSDLVEEVIRETNSILFTDKSDISDKVKVESIWTAPENFPSLDIPNNWNSLSTGLENLKLKDVDISRHCYNPVFQSQLIVSSTVQSCIQADNTQDQNMGISIADLVYSFPP